MDKLYMILLCLMIVPILICIKYSRKIKSDVASSMNLRRSSASRSACCEVGEIEVESQTKVLLFQEMKHFLI